MATSFAKTLERIIRLCQAFLDNVAILRRDIYDDYAVVRVEGEYKQHLIRVREIARLDGSRKYSYYAFYKTRVVAGFDNASDPKALQLKYGKNYSDHRLEAIPHHHTPTKQNIHLTEEMDCPAFLQWLEKNI